MNYLALFEEDDKPHKHETNDQTPIAHNAQQQNSYQTRLNEALSLISSLYPEGFLETLMPEQKKQIHESQQKLDEALLDPKVNHLNSIAEWERTWLLFLGYHPVPQESVSRIQPWDHQKVFDTLLRGHPVKIWSVVLGEWLYWVRDAKVAEKVAAKYPAIPIYTLQELKIMVLTAWTREYLQKAHLAKSVLGATLMESSRNARGQT